MFFLFWILFAVVFLKLIMFALKASWSIVKLIFCIGFLPIILIIVAIEVSIYLAIPVLVCVGIYSLVKSL
ncbi:hypothetical protein [Butyrivibrio sp. NC3005]|uniref:hypothetical protein n=1 Tax=Butyrivibrio sp. NC3005 TaxID=1280685 RepID=UPI00041286B4|nr:hypothetical protein [Butyrivibrio sp. NC3005]